MGKLKDLREKLNGGSLSAEEQADVKSEIARIEKWMADNGKGKSGSSTGFQKKFTPRTEEVTEIKPTGVKAHEGLMGDYLVKFATAEAIVAKLFPGVKIGTTQYFIKLFAIIHDL